MIRNVMIGPYKLFADDGSQTGLVQLQNGRNYEAHIVKELERLLPNSVGFADLGCNVGIHTLNAKVINPQIPIVCADVSQVNIDLLLRTIKFNGLENIIVLPFALADDYRIIHTNDHEPNTTCSLEGHADSEAYPNLAVAFSLDMMLSLPSVDVIKLDVEGCELLVLKGASRWLARHPTILFEFCPEITHRSGATPKELLEFFFDHGYDRLTMLENAPCGRQVCTAPDQVLQHLTDSKGWICDILVESP